MEKCSELLKHLVCAEALMVSDLTAEQLGSVPGVSPATLKRYLAFLRELGCDIVSVRSSRGTVYRLVNKDAVSHTLTAWLRLERARDLTIDDCAGCSRRG